MINVHCLNILSTSDTFHFDKLLRRLIISTIVFTILIAFGVFPDKSNILHELILV